MFPNSSLCSETAPPGGLLSRINSYRPFDKPVNGAISFTVLGCRPFPQRVRLFRTVNQYLVFLLSHFRVRSPSNSPHRGSTCDFCFLSLSGLQKTVHVPWCHSSLFSAPLTLLSAAPLIPISGNKTGRRIGAPPTRCTLSSETLGKEEQAESRDNYI